MRSTLAMLRAERTVSGSREPVRSYFPLKDLDIVRRAGAFESVAFYATDQGVVSAEGQTEAVEFAAQLTRIRRR